MKEDIIKRWILKAKSDLKTARILMQSNELTDIVCFHAQQAVEKLLKAYLTYKNIKSSKTHDISVLLKLCIKEDKDFNSLDIEKLEQLTFYAVEVRYPDDFYVPDIEEAKAALEQANKLWDFIIKKLKDVIREDWIKI